MAVASVGLAVPPGTIDFVAETAAVPELIKRCAELKDALLRSGVYGDEARVLLLDIQREQDRLVASRDRRGRLLPAVVGAGLGVAAAGAAAASGGSGGAVRTAQEIDAAGANACCAAGEQTAGEMALAASIAVCLGCLAAAGIAYGIYRLIADKGLNRQDPPWTPGSRVNAFVVRYNALVTDGTLVPSD